MVAFDSILGSPVSIGRVSAFLSGTIEQEAARLWELGLEPGDPHAPIKQFITENKDLFGHGIELLAAANLEQDDVTAHNGARTVIWQQQVNGIPIYAARLIGHITKAGELISLSSTFLPDPSSAADAGTPQHRAFQSNPPVSAKQAVVEAA